MNWYFMESAPLAVASLSFHRFLHRSIDPRITVVASETWKKRLPPIRHQLTCWFLQSKNIYRIHRPVLPFLSISFYGYKTMEAMLITFKFNFELVSISVPGKMTKNRKHDQEISLARKSETPILAINFSFGSAVAIGGTWYEKRNNLQESEGFRSKHRVLTRRLKSINRVVQTRLLWLTVPDKKHQKIQPYCWDYWRSVSDW